LAIALARMRGKHRFALAAWLFLPDQWHGLIYPPHPLSISRAMSAVKVSSMIAINHGRHEKGRTLAGTILRPRAAHDERVRGDC
jgi:REP element-mobilizing transposase RayT